MSCENKFNNNILLLFLALPHNFSSNNCTTIFSKCVLLLNHHLSLCLACLHLCSATHGITNKQFSWITHYYRSHPRLDCYRCRFFFFSFLQIYKISNVRNFEAILGSEYLIVIVGQLFKHSTKTLVNMKIAEF
jgi:hypothetical protein